MAISVLKKIKGLVASADTRTAEPARIFQPVAVTPEAQAGAARHLYESMQLYAQGRLEEAAAACERAIAANPNSAEAFRHVGIIFWELGRILESAACFNQALKIEPGRGSDHHSLAQALLKLNRTEDAIVALRKALELNPDAVATLAQLAEALFIQGKSDEAVAICRRVVEISPHGSDAFTQLAKWKRSRCDWESYAADDGQLLKYVRTGSTTVAPYDILMTASTARDQLVCARNYVRGSILPLTARYPDRKISRSDKLRIGYLSSDFRIHAVAYLIVELFELHDRSRFEVYGYSTGIDDKSDIRKRIAAAFDRFVECEAGRQIDVAKTIHDDEIDILIDLNGYTRNNGIRILARRPAPIQVNYLGYPGTMGVDFVDYIIADPTVLPRQQQKFYSEKVVYLPDCYQVNDSKRPIADRTPSRSVCELPETGFVFCCFNRPEKITPTLFDIWMRLLANVPGSVLWLLGRNETMSANLGREAQARGIDSSRLVFAPRLLLPAHLSRHRLADLFLDTLPYNAHTTMSDALWAGLPALTCIGDTFAGRVGASLLRAIDLPELITTSLAEYEARALALARSPDELAGLRRKLADRRATTPLFDSARFTRNVESAYMRMAELHRGGKAPQPIVIGSERP
jgi:predicted O-linked N-acetylglucosamine transferase (SPINDLY family)